jgi:signal transduction histidine kinase
VSEGLLGVSGSATGESEAAARRKCLRESRLLEQRFRGLLGAVPDAVLIINDDGRIALLGANAELMFGYGRQELLGQPLEMLLQVVVRAVAQDADRLRVEVEDHGIGIAADDIALLFVEFQQLDGGLGRRHLGTGLGLALTRRIVEAQGGRVGVQSTRGVGSLFYAILPQRLDAATGTNHVG